MGPRKIVSPRISILPILQGYHVYSLVTTYLPEDTAQILHTRKEKPKIPLSPQWWHSFHNKKPAWYGPNAWHPRTIDFGEMEQLKNVMLADLQVVVIGGSHRYYSPDDLAAFFSPFNENAYNKHIDVGHIADFFMGGSQGGAVVLHFPAIDSQEMAQEARSWANWTGDFIDVSEAELERRVATLFGDETVKIADAIGAFLLGFHYLP